MYMDLESQYDDEKYKYLKVILDYHFNQNTLIKLIC